ncbi:electron transport complex subunit RsxC, partial [uncultured Oscillibacter sp.]|uniref:electron transport complex subunit RsxC n=1 Tax=uncultured Oscillibacter sp. TaxID=876091 RepID=UPI0028060647
MGQKIGDGEGLCVPVHASVSGTVTAIEPRSHPSGQPCLAVAIENDFQNTYHSAVQPCSDTDALDDDAMISRIREAGLVGMGGATFPTDIKANIGKVETLIANACECEPYITADDALLCTDADRAIRGLRLLRQLLKPRRTVIAIEDNKERAVSILTDKLKQQDEVELVVLPTRYPQGAEKQLIQAVTGRQVPSGGFPKDVGCAVFNIATCASVCRAVADGEPVLRRIVTVTGHGIKEPKNLIVPIGTPFAHAIEAAGGLQGDVWKVIAGGPMMGRSQADLTTPVIKGTNAIVALTSADDLESPHPSCIRCGRCVSVCPMGLQPLYLYRFSRCRDVEMLRHYSILDCVECGCCAYTCPGKL